MSAVREAYERVQYPHYVHPLADVARVAAIARLLGIDAVDPAAARVLDIGCGAGGGLIAMAARLPATHFLGIDFSEPDIASARALAAEAGLTNIVFEQADLARWTPVADRFDYIIAWGVFSWVPDDVKERLLAVVRESLSPDGVALVSYMTYPGCKTAEALRDVLSLHTGALDSPAEKVAEAHRILDFLDEGWAAFPKAPHTAHLRDRAARIRRKEPHLLLLDDLGVERDPCYLLQFAGWAAEHGLRYLGDAEFGTMLLENLPPESARKLRAMNLDQLHTEQMIDYITDRSFRASLLVGPSASVQAGVDRTAIRRLCLSPILHSLDSAKANPKAGRFRDAHGGKITLHRVPLVSFVRSLAGFPGAFTAYSVVLARSEALAGRSFTVEEETQLLQDLVVLYGRKQIALSAVPRHAAGALTTAFALTPLNRLFAARRSMVVTPLHTSLRLTAEQQALCALLAQPSSLEQLRASSEGAAMGAELVPFINRLASSGCLESVPGGVERAETGRTILSGS